MIEALGAIALASAGVGTLSALWFFMTARREPSPDRIAEMVERRSEIIDLARETGQRSQWRLHAGLALGAGLIFGGLAADGAGGWAVIGGIVALLAISGFLVDLGARRRLTKALEVVGDE